MAEPVYLRVYDISDGAAALWSPVLLGKRIRGVWHTGIVVYGIEYFYGGGIVKMSPNDVEEIYGIRLHREHYLGVTHVEQRDFERYLISIQRLFSPDCYDLMQWNCNNFTNHISYYLLGKSIPMYILELPDELQRTFVGKLIIQLIKMFSEAPAIDSKAAHHPKQTLRAAAPDKPVPAQRRVSSKDYHDPCHNRGFFPKQTTMRTASPLSCGNQRRCFDKTTNRLVQLNIRQQYTPKRQQRVVSVTQDKTARHFRSLIPPRACLQKRRQKQQQKERRGRCPTAFKRLDTAAALQRRGGSFYLHREETRRAQQTPSTRLTSLQEREEGRHSYKMPSSLVEEGVSKPPVMFLTLERFCREDVRLTRMQQGRHMTKRPTQQAPLMVPTPPPPSLSNANPNPRERSIEHKNSLLQKSSFLYYTVPASARC